MCRDHGRRGDPWAVPRRPAACSRPARSTIRPRGRPRRPRSCEWSRPSPGVTSAGRDHVAGRKLLRHRPRGRGDLGARRNPTPCAAHRRRPVGRRRHPPLLRYVVRSDADRPVFLFLTIRPDEFGLGDRGGALRGGHGADGPRSTAAARTVQLVRNGGAPEARPRRSGRFRFPRPRCTCSPRACPSSSRSWPGRTARPAPSSRSMASGGSAATQPGSCRPRSGRSSIAARRDFRPGHGPRSVMERSSAGASAFETCGDPGAGGRWRDRRRGGGRQARGDE